MAASRQTIALAAVGSMGKFVCEDLLADDRFNVVVISRGVRSPSAPHPYGTIPDTAPLRPPSDHLVVVPYCFD